MSAEDLLAWGAIEDAARKADIATLKAGGMSFDDAKERARQRRGLAGLTDGQAALAVAAAQRAARLAR